MPKIMPTHRPFAGADDDLGIASWCGTQLEATPPAQPVPVTAVDALRLDQEPKAGPGEVAHRLHGKGFSCGDDEDSGHVAGAVAEPSPGLAVSGVLEGAPIIRHSA